MSITLNEKMKDPGPDIAYSADFRRVLEDHIPWLLSLSSTITLDISSDVAVKADGDLITVLHHYNLPTGMHWLIMRMNGYTSPMQYSMEHNRLFIPSQEDFSSIMKVHRTTQKMNKSSKK